MMNKNTKDTKYKNESSYKNLYKKMDATSKTRFHNSRRLKLHAKLSTYTVVVISLGLILISLMQAYNLGNNIDSKLVGLIQVFSAIAVLVYSLLVEKNDYSSLSEKMYSCAAKIGELKQRFYPHIENKHDDKIYDKFEKDYYSVLKLYETHSTNDFRGDYYRAKIDMPKFYKLGFFKNMYIRIQIYLSYTFNFISYPTVMGVLIYVLYWLWFGENYSPKK